MPRHFVVEDEVTNWLDLVPRPIDVAIHEAAHIISAYKLGMPLPEGASIIPQAKCLGHVALTWIKPWSEDVQYSGQPNLTQSYFVRNLVCLLSGYAANFRHRRNTKINSRHRVQALVQVYSPERGGGVEGDDVLLAFFCVKNFDTDEEIRKSLFLDAWDFTWENVRFWWQRGGNPNGAEDVK